MTETVREAKTAKAAARKIVFDGVPEGTQTWLEEAIACTCAGKTPRHPAGSHSRPVINYYGPGDETHVGDLEDGSERSRLIKSALERGLCHFKE